MTDTKLLFAAWCLAVVNEGPLTEIPLLQHFIVSSCILEARVCISVAAGSLGTGIPFLPFLPGQSRFGEFSKSSAAQNSIRDAKWLGTFRVIKISYFWYFDFSKARESIFGVGQPSASHEQEEKISTRNESPSLSILLLLLSSSSSSSSSSLSLSSSSSSPLCRVFILIFLRQTMSLGNTELQLFCCYYSWCLYH